MTDLGKVGMRPRGEHVAGNAYEKNDIVKYENVVYCCLKDTPNAPSATDTEFWQVWSRDAPPMTGATATSDGASGIVPQPMRGDENRVLLGSGVWGDVNVEVDDALSDTSENPVQNKVVDGALKDKLDATGDSKDTTVTFTSDDTLAPTELAQMPDILKSGETHDSFLKKASTVFKNMRYIIGLLGSTDISKETLGLGDSTLTGAVSAINESLQSALRIYYYDVNTDINVLENRKQAVLNMIKNTIPRLNQSNDNDYSFVRFIRTIRYYDGANTQCIVTGYGVHFTVTEIAGNAVYPSYIYCITNDNFYSIVKILTENI